MATACACEGHLSFLNILISIRLDLLLEFLFAYSDAVTQLLLGLLQTMPFCYIALSNPVYRPCKTFYFPIAQVTAWYVVSIQLLFPLAWSSRNSNSINVMSHHTTYRDQEYCSPPMYCIVCPPNSIPCMLPRVLCSELAQSIATSLPSLSPTYSMVPITREIYSQPLYFARSHHISVPLQYQKRAIVSL